MTVLTISEPLVVDVVVMRATGMSVDWDGWLAALAREFDVRWLAAVPRPAPADRERRAGLVRIGRDESTELRELVEGFYRDHRAELVRTARGRLSNVEDAQEAVNEVIRRILTNPPRLSHSDMLGPYLHKAVRNEAIERLRQLIRRRENEDARVEVTAELVDRVRPSGAAVEDTVIRQLVIAKALGRLPDRQREVFLLVEREGHTMQTAAEVIGVSAGSVKRYLHEARSALRADVSLRQLRSVA
ncbi:RNA polymerase sigma factor [Pseudonocardia spinosispora]|uniref:RNA polymerase sigma factor n=1 Tax=Pseudonocardia spinosispora TaxID=103441 RepID=UPI0003F7A4DB|nr:RNA polymerase sigma factor [Pseudonocardia spinosispora]